MRAKKSLGQHFLTDIDIISRIIEAVKPHEGDNILEIGPGRGALTFPLVNSGADITAVELDRILAPELAEKLKDHRNFEIIEADILRFNPSALGLNKFKVVGNLPYNITTPVMDWLFKYQDRIESAVFMMQKEVGERVISPPGKKSRSTISVLTELYFTGEVICQVQPEAFKPPPKIESAVIKLMPVAEPLTVTDLARFEKFVRFCFSAKRKKLSNNLNSAYPLERSELVEIISVITGNPDIRAEQMALAEFIRLSDAIFNRLKKAT